MPNGGSMRLTTHLFCEPFSMAPHSRPYIPDISLTNHLQMLLSSIHLQQRGCLTAAWPQETLWNEHDVLKMQTLCETGFACRNFNFQIAQCKVRMWRFGGRDGQILVFWTLVTSVQPPNSQHRLWLIVFSKHFSHLTMTQSSRTEDYT